MYNLTKKHPYILSFRYWYFPIYSFPSKGDQYSLQISMTIEPFLNILFIIQPFIMIISKRDWIKKDEDFFSNLQIVEKYFNL